ncbi:uncharacterized protein SEPMUDRAFT_133746 [Sphaerulina musiva SO2202]|uniref:Uncharacterized protein n=1 Tax=Sphaerulina musiva (strain SO2202) TaxID=692275 RepID=N1QH21_SPHMS|nr:uncharacterized protein SEPMUDRAFT_133746 [Sphaerulina musiva SO2202]EMF11749.1 hypothetical protein SEPMUDRAFT_133746 [Sphaerulina musiva SO2202]
MSNFALQIDCQAAPATAKSDAGIAGAGVILAFIITAGLALIASSFIVISEIRGRNSRNISRKILSGLSDQMLVEGIAIQVVGLARIYSTVPYHFFIIWMLSLLSTATNFAALLALVQDLKRDWVLRWLRQFAMFVNMVLGITFGIFILKTNVDKLAPTLPMACVWQAHQQDGAAQGNQALSIVGTSVVIAAACIIFVLGTWYLHLRRQIWGKTVRLMSLIVLMAIAIGVTVRVILIAQALGGTPSVNLADRGETEWTFGQLLTMLLLILPFISALEIFRGQMQVPHANAYGDSDQMPLTSGDGAELKPVPDKYTFQPNPFLRS